MSVAVSRLARFLRSPRSISPSLDRPSAVRRSPFTRGVSLVLFAALHASACHSETPDLSSAQRIVSLAPHLTELTFSAGAGDRLVGTVAYSDYPLEAKRIPQIGDAFRIDLERLLALRPDVVLAWESGTPQYMIERMQALGLKVTSIETRRLNDVGAALERIGELAHTQQTASQAAARFATQIDALRAQYSTRPRVSVFIQVNDRPIHTVNGAQIISEVVELCGGENVFAGLNELAPIVGLEAVIAANPQVILATDDTVRDVAGYWGRWPHIAAVRTGAVYSVSSDHLSRATTRLAAGAQEVCRLLDKARELEPARAH